MAVPGAGEQAFAQKTEVDQGTHGGIVEMAPVVDAEFGEDAARAVVEIADQRGRVGRQENIAQQVAVVVRVEPADEQRLCCAVPGGGVPIAVENIGGPS